ncbi:hypothetical protein HMPREF0326_03255 [Desulfovibrio sp. 3_1_syn3]|uniref:HNH endonuclease signature motif containing protein n=1 Tax=Desulfovibrio sp. 3_1_syn3 TaxID=457398 RepID=UPI00038FD8D7|nr:HNH endonuclease signature motif containing protein [Desulfovibrio sp. 3_1_syn3]EFL84199.2 hypothetical protein HMPREF0326_03255 [Desulfovibrio sp. 3_1_syn3]
MFRYSGEMISFLREHKEKMKYIELTKEFNKRFGQNKSIRAIKRVCFDNELCKKVRYDNEIKEFIKDIISGLSYSKITKIVNEKFKTNKSVRQIKSFCIYHKIYNGKGKKNSEHFVFTDEMIKFIKKNIQNINYNELTVQFNKYFSVNISKSILKNKCYSLGFFNGVTFDQPLFTEHLGKDGYLIKTKKGWIPKQRFLWEQKNGPVPDGYCIIFADGDKTNFNENNLIKVNRKEHFHLNKRKLRFSDPEYTKAGLNIVKLFLKAEERQKEIDDEEPEKENQPEEA